MARVAGGAGDMFVETVVTTLGVMNTTYAAKIISAPLVCVDLDWSCISVAVAIQTVEIRLHLLLLQKAAVVVVFLLKQLSNERTQKQRC